MSITAFSANDILYVSSLTFISREVIKGHPEIFIDFIVELSPSVTISLKPKDSNCGIADNVTFFNLLKSLKFISVSCKELYSVKFCTYLKAIKVLDVSSFSLVFNFSILGQFVIETVAKFLGKAFSSLL